MRRWLADPDTRLLVAELDGRIAAVGGVSTAGEVLLNYVAPAPASAASAARSSPVSKPRSRPSATPRRAWSTATAHRFYRARGWHDAGSPVGHRGVPGQPMQKHLG